MVRPGGDLDQHGSAGLQTVTAAVIAAAAVRPGEQIVDLGCGNGQLSLPLADQGAQVLAIDVSPAMVAALKQEAAQRGLPGLDAVALPIEGLALPEGSLDLVVSSYALHHLRDADKAKLVDSVFHWLRPGGRLACSMARQGPVQETFTTSKDVQEARTAPQLRQPAVTIRFVPGGGHTMRTWRQLLPPMLEWMTQGLARETSAYDRRSAGEHRGVAGVRRTQAAVRRCFAYPSGPG